jgi:DNA-directed RNA polymerase subunit RPC12/RpoP
MASCRDPAGGEKDVLRIADVLRVALLSNPRRLPAWQWKTLNALLCCRTERLGGHLYRCEDCGKEHFVPHSCRNRHCPNCQRAGAEQWLEKETASLLPVPYFHVVFTLPHVLNPLIAQNQRALYNLLFAAASATLMEFGKRRFEAQIGITAVLHTWSQTLMDHYHLHCIVTGGGLSSTGWKSAGDGYLFPVDALSEVFRAKFRDGLKELHARGGLVFHGQIAALSDPEHFRNLLIDAQRSPWMVYSKKPFAGPEAVLAYLSRYTHRVAIGNGRIQALDPKLRTVTFSYKDYADHARRKTMTLDLDEFLRRFCLHILPPRFVKIRHYGLLGNHQRAEKIARARELMGCDPAVAGPPCSVSKPASEPSAPQPRCPHCGSVRLLFAGRRKPVRRPPAVCDSS